MKKRDISRSIERALHERWLREPIGWGVCKRDLARAKAEIARLRQRLERYEKPDAMERHQDGLLSHGCSCRWLFDKDEPRTGHDHGSYRVLTCPEHAELYKENDRLGAENAELRSKLPSALCPLPSDPQYPLRVLSSFLRKLGGYSESTTRGWDHVFPQNRIDKDTALVFMTQALEEARSPSPSWAAASSEAERRTPWPETTDERHDGEVR